MTDRPVRVTVDEGIATITLSRPERMNAVTSAMLRILDEVVRGVNADASITGVIVTGDGRAFCAGRDLAELDEVRAAERARSIPEPGGHESSMFARIEVPTVAAVNGAAVGAGLGFAVQCDYIVASREAVLKDGHIVAGMVPSVAAWYVPRRIGAAAAMEFFASQRATTAEEALRLGLIDEVVPPEELLDAARAHLEPFRTIKPELLRHTTLLCRRAATASIGEQMESVGFLRSIERRADP